jgi:hypothetical protein
MQTESSPGETQPQAVPPAVLRAGGPLPTVKLEQQLAQYPLLDALRGRRSRRFGTGMKIPSGPFTYESKDPALPLSEDEEAALAFAACGVTGYALADLSYGPAQGGAELLELRARTVSSPSAANCVAVIVTNDEATYLLRRPQDFPRAEFGDLVQLAQAGALTELYRRSRVKIADGRIAIPVEPGYNFNINKWSLYAPGGTYFLPIHEMTGVYLSAALEVFDKSMGYFILDERNNFQPAGLAHWARSKNGHLNDDPHGGRLGTIQAIEMSLAEGVAVEAGMVLQNVSLMAQALGLGGFVNFARHEFAWFEALGFRMGHMPASHYLGAGHLVSAILGLLGRDQPVPYPLGLEREGQVLLQPYCPPYYASMGAAVRALVESKFGPNGIYRDGGVFSSWRDPAQAASIPPPSDEAVEALSGYCEYIYQRYGRFPAYSAPFRTTMGFQATHVDVEFYDRFFKPDALTETQREHMARWHQGH